MVEHIYNASKQLFQGTKHEDDWCFYHDALSLMNANDCKRWMEAKGILSRWILPLNNLNAGTPYDGHPVGNSPELMPLDCSLFRDLKISVYYHVCMTKHLHERDEKGLAYHLFAGGCGLTFAFLSPRQNLTQEVQYPAESSNI